jgi:hypothetical protein
LKLPVGGTYTRTGGAKLPGDVLLDYNGTDITDQYTTDQRNNCLHPGTTWKLSVPEGRFLRQRGGDYYISSSTKVYYDRYQAAEGQTSLIESDGINGTPRTANETRPQNIGGEYWERIL